MPDLPAHETPAEQVALRSAVEALLRDYAAVASYRHHERFWTSTDGREAVYGWGTTIEPRAGGVPVHVWFDGLDDDITVSTDDSRWRGRDRGVWYEWRDLADLDAVLGEVTEALRESLSGYIQGRGPAPGRPNAVPASALSRWRRGGRWRWPTAPPPTVPPHGPPRFGGPNCHAPLGAEDRCDARGAELPRDASP